MTSIDQRLRRDADHDAIEKLVVGAVVHRSDSHVLILRRSPGDDFMPGIEELPSGSVEEGEDILAALERELAEETGLSCSRFLTGGQGEPFTASFDYTSGSGRRARQYTFAVPYDGSPIVLSQEHTDYRWLDPSDQCALVDSDLTPETITTIRAWANRAKQ
jgi:8-oxo-dGTP diphosphatase